MSTSAAVRGHPSPWLTHWLTRRLNPPCQAAFTGRLRRPLNRSARHQRPEGGWPSTRSSTRPTPRGNRCQACPPVTPFGVASSWEVQRATEQATIFVQSNSTPRGTVEASELIPMFVGAASRETAPRGCLPLVVPRPKVAGRGTHPCTPLPAHPSAHPHLAGLPTIRRQTERGTPRSCHLMPGGSEGPAGRTEGHEASTEHHRQLSIGGSSNARSKAAGDHLVLAARLTGPAVPLLSLVRRQTARRAPPPTCWRRSVLVVRSPRSSSHRCGLAITAPVLARHTSPAAIGALT